MPDKNNNMPIEISWVKILTNTFRNQKILLIRALPEGDALVCMWLQMICMAGELNDNGLIYLSPGVAYELPDELATIMGRSIPVTQLALHTFTRYKMIEIDEQGFILLRNFTKIQNIEGMDRVRELNRARQQRFRHRQKQITAPVLPSVALHSVIVTMQEKKEIREEKKEIREEEDTTGELLNIFNEIKKIKYSIENQSMNKHNKRIREWDIEMLHQKADDLIKDYYDSLPAT